MLGVGDRVALGGDRAVALGVQRDALDAEVASDSLDVLGELDAAELRQPSRIDPRFADAGRDEIVDHRGDGVEPQRRLVALAGDRTVDVVGIADAARIEQDDVEALDESGIERADVASAYAMPLIPGPPVAMTSVPCGVPVARWRP